MLIWRNFYEKSVAVKFRNFHSVPHTHSVQHTHSVPHTHSVLWNQRHSVKICKFSPHDFLQKFRQINFLTK